jgi:hypothetical protein
MKNRVAKKLWTFLSLIKKKEYAQRKIRKEKRTIKLAFTSNTFSSMIPEVKKVGILFAFDIVNCGIIISVKSGRYQ